MNGSSEGEPRLPSVSAAVMVHALPAGDVEAGVRDTLSSYPLSRLSTSTHGGSTRDNTGTCPTPEVASSPVRRSLDASYAYGEGAGPEGEEHGAGAAGGHCWLRRLEAGRRTYLCCVPLSPAGGRHICFLIHGSETCSLTAGSAAAPACPRGCLSMTRQAAVQRRQPALSAQPIHANKPFIACCQPQAIR